MFTKKNTYKALIWQVQADATGKRVTVIAESMEQARVKLEEKYGHDAIFDLHGDAMPSRSGEQS